MEVQTFLVQWPADDPRRQARLIRALRVAYWERLDSTESMTEMPLRAFQRQLWARHLPGRFAAPLFHS